MKRLLWILFWIIVGPAAIGVVGVMASLIFSSFPHSTKQIAEVDLQSVEVSQLQPDGELAEKISFFSSATDLQREQLLNDIKGKVVSWQLEVYDISSYSDGSIVIQTTGTGVVGTFCHVRTLSDVDRKRLTSINSGDLVKCKGIIKDISLRNLEIDPAIIE